MKTNSFPPGTSPLRTRRFARMIALLTAGAILTLGSLAFPSPAGASLLQPGKTASARTADIITQCTATIQKSDSIGMVVKVHAEARPAGLGGYLNNAITRVRCVVLNQDRGTVMYDGAVVKSGPTASFDSTLATALATFQVCVEAVVVKKDSTIVTAGGCSS